MKKILLSFITMSLMLVTASINISADDKVVISRESIHLVDEYITVKNNRYELKLPKEVSIDKSLEKEIKSQIKDSNKLIKEENLVIDPTTKIAEAQIMTRAYGRNGIKVTWNSVIIHMDAGAVKLIAGMKVTAGATAIAVIFNALAPAVATAVATYLIMELGVNNIKNGRVIHYNFFYGRVTYSYDQ